MPKIFISYRRNDVPLMAKQLYSELIQHFPESDVFMDVDSIQYGVNFLASIERHVILADLVLVPIGPYWNGQPGERRLMDPNDLVRLELELALRHQKRILPILIGPQTQFPRQNDLPPSLATLPFLNAPRFPTALSQREQHQLVSSILALSQLQFSTSITGQQAMEITHNPPKIVKEQSRPRSRVKLLLALGAAFLLIVSGILLYANITPPITTSQVQATATANAHIDTLNTAIANTATARVQNSNPYGGGGTLVISDPMSGPGSAFTWDIGNAQYGQCSFKDGGYHVSGLCRAKGTGDNLYIPAKFAFEIRLFTGHNCGQLEFDFDFGGTGPKNITFYAEVCQNGDYNLNSLIDPTGSDSGENQQGSAGQAMHTGLDQSNIIGVVADGSRVGLYINRVKVTSIADTNALAGTMTLWGQKNLVSNQNAEVVYTDARLWSL